MEQCQSIVSHQHLNASVLSTIKDQEQAASIERLPFTIKRVQCDEDLWKAVHVRHAAYARHLPSLAQSLSTPEAIDYDDDVAILLAESKLDGSSLGTLRIQTNFHQRLAVEQSVELPKWMQGRRLAEVTRLGVEEGRIGRLVKIALIKTSFQYCEQNYIDWALATGRAPIDRQYEQLLFSDIFPDKGYMPLRHVGNLPHRVMAFEIETGQARWEDANHPLLNFFCHTHHPDIDIGDASDTLAPRLLSSHVATRFSGIEAVERSIV